MKTTRIRTGRYGDVILDSRNTGWCHPSLVPNTTYDVTVRKYKRGRWMVYTWLGTWFLYHNGYSICNQSAMPLVGYKPSRGDRFSITIKKVEEMS